MADDTDYLINYKPNQLYTHPADKGAYATIVGDSEEVVIGEIEVTSRCKLAVSAFYVRDKNDFGTLQITKLQWHKTFGWRRAGQMRLNDFQLVQMKEFLSIISNLNLSDARKARLSLDNLHIGALGALLSSTKGAAIIEELAASPELHHDIYAVAAKRAALTEFESNLQNTISEPEWQSFFERNSWVFGHGLNYIFLDNVGKKLEMRTTGHAFDQAGKTVDALMRTRAEISQYVLVEIKKNTTPLLQSKEYRSGCWGVSEEVSNAVTQIQKTAFQFGQNRFRDVLKDQHGNDTGESVYSVEPRCFLVVGNLGQVKTNDDKIACFELYRRNVRSPEIITFDELFHRAKCIVENIKRNSVGELQ
jgi:hypothetical protein